MKRLASIVVSVLFAGLTTAVFAQDNTAAGASTPAANAPAASSSSGIPEHPGKVIEWRIKNQYKRIMAGVRSKKITPDEAKTLRANVAAVQQQLKADATQDKQSGEKKITGDQYTQLKQMLDTNSLAIKDDKNDGETDSNAAPAGTAAPSGNAATTPTNQ
jgi:hypothetical protein